MVADNCLGTRRVWIDMTGKMRSILQHFYGFQPFASARNVTCIHAGDSDRAHMHNFNDFMIKQRSRWDVV